MFSLCLSKNIGIPFHDAFLSFAAHGFLSKQKPRRFTFWSLLQKGSVSSQRNLPEEHLACCSLGFRLIVEQCKKRTRTYRVRQVGRRYATQLYERVTLFLKLFRYI